MNLVKEPHTCIFSGPTSCGKTQLALNLIEKEYRYYFENIVILCPTLQWNKTYRERLWICEDDSVYLINPKDNLFKWIEKLSQELAGDETLFIVDDIIADATLDTRRQSLLELAISGRHKKHSLWILTQSLTAIPKNLRRQKKQLFCWYPNEKSDLKIIDEETNTIPDGEWPKLKDDLKSEKYACLYMKLEHPREWKILI